MRGITNKDVEHEALTAKDNGREFPEIISPQKDQCNQSRFSCSRMSLTHKSRIALVFVTLLLILVICMAIMLSVFLSNTKNGANFNLENIEPSRHIKQHDSTMGPRKVNEDSKGNMLITITYIMEQLSFHGN